MSTAIAYTSHKTDEIFHYLGRRFRQLKREGVFKKHHRLDDYLADPERTEQLARETFDIARRARQEKAPGLGKRR